MIDKLENYGYCAVELYFSAVCNLNCVYCFQPKISCRGNEINKEIIDWISSGRMEDDILKYLGDSVEYISFWGGEPSINLPYLTERFDTFISKFPHLKQLQYSTNISTRKLAQNTVDFIKAIDKHNKENNDHVFLKLQLSIDGCPEINDKNRIGASAKNIIDNTTYLLEQTKDITCYHSHFKATQSSESIAWLSKDDNLYKNYKFWEDNYKEWEKITDRYPRGGEIITIVFPGNYTTQDGINYAKVEKELLSKEFQSRFTLPMNFTSQMQDRVTSAYSQLKRAYYRNNTNELRKNLSCSSCKTCFGLDHQGHYHICHSTFFFDPETRQYIKDNGLITEYERTQGFSFSLFKDHLEDKSCVSFENDYELIRLLKNGREYSSDITMREQYIDMMIRELAASGQIDKKYLEDDNRRMAIIFGLFGNGECVLNNCWEFGSYFIRNYSQLRLALNGALDVILEGRFNK